jgi:hypothetical protein
MSDVASLVSAFGTVGAFGVALYLLFVQVRDRRSEAEDRRSAQARSVAAWFDDAQPVLDIAAPPGRNAPPKFFEVAVLVRNGSTEPVYHVVVRTDVGVLGEYVRFTGALGPGETRRLGILVPPIDLRSSLPTVSIMFSDSAGAVWIRGDDGALAHPKDGEVETFAKESPGAYTVESHPTLSLGRGPEANRGRRLP